MVKLTTTDVEKLEKKDIINMSDTIHFSSSVSMAKFVKKLNPLHKSYTADYTNFSITFN